MAHHDNIPIWEVEISVIGPVSIQETIRISARKEIEHSEAFYSKVLIKNNTNGFTATLTAFAPNSELAEKAAIIFFGRMLDVLSLRLNLPLQLDLTNNVIIQKTSENVRRIVDKDDFLLAFADARLLNLTKTTLSRSLSWFRKGKYSQDPFDKYLAFWNSIEITSSKYNRNKDACKGKGTKCHIWECFKYVWGKCDKWEFIGGQKKWIDECNEIRKNVAHGTIPIDVNSIEKILTKLPELENVSQKFLTDWMLKETEGVVDREIHSKLR